jgi:hypothetical protein
VAPSFLPVHQFINAIFEELFVLFLVSCRKIRLGFKARKTFFERAKQQIVTRVQTGAANGWCGTSQINACHYYFLNNDSKFKKFDVCRSVQGTDLCGFIHNTLAVCLRGIKFHHCITNGKGFNFRNV